MQYHVPQFLEVEDKIFGQFTLRQFLYILGGVAMAYLAYTYLYWLIAIPIILACLGLSIALAFIPYNNKPFIFIMEAAIKYVLSPKLFIWKKIPKEKKQKGEEETSHGVYVPPLSESSLKDLAWSLDIKEHEVRTSHPLRKAPLLKDL